MVFTAQQLATIHSLPKFEKLRSLYFETNETAWYLEYLQEILIVAPSIDELMLETRDECGTESWKVSPKKLKRLSASRSAGLTRGSIFPLSTFVGLEEFSPGSRQFQEIDHDFFITVGPTLRRLEASYVNSRSLLPFIPLLLALTHLELDIINDFDFFALLPITLKTLKLRGNEILEGSLALFKAIPTPLLLDSFSIRYPTAMPELDLGLIFFSRVLMISYRGGSILPSLSSVNRDQVGFKKLILAGEIEQLVDDRCSELGIELEVVW